MFAWIFLVLSALAGEVPDLKTAVEQASLLQEEIKDKCKSVQTMGDIVRVYAPYLPILHDTIMRVDVMQNHVLTTRVEMYNERPLKPDEVLRYMQLADASDSIWAFQLEVSSTFNDYKMNKRLLQRGSTSFTESVDSSTCQAYLSYVPQIVVEMTILQLHIHELTHPQNTEASQ